MNNRGFVIVEADEEDVECTMRKLTLMAARVRLNLAWDFELKLLTRMTESDFSP